MKKLAPIGVSPAMPHGRILAIAVASSLATLPAVAQLSTDISANMESDISTGVENVIAVDSAVRAEASGESAAAASKAEMQANAKAVTEGKMQAAKEAGADAKTKAEAKATAEASAANSMASERFQTMKDKGVAAKASAQTKLEAGGSAMMDKADEKKAAVKARATTEADAGFGLGAAATAEMANKSADMTDAMQGKANVVIEDGKTTTTEILSTGAVVKSIVPTVSGNARADARSGDKAAVTLDADMGVSGNSNAGIFTQATVLKPVTQTKVDGYTAISGGIGEQETRRMKAASGSYNTRMTFAALPTGSYLPDVRVKILSAASGDLLVDAVSPGPLFYIQLPDGRYKVEASGYGAINKKDFSIQGNSKVDLLLHWKQ